jgi:hypothetical protein
METSMRYACLIPLAALPLLSAPALAGEPPKPVTDKSVSAQDVAETPVTDLNLKHDKIPQVLVNAQTGTYDLTGIHSCPQIASAVGELNTVLGPDLDLPQGEQNGVSAGRVAQSVVGSFIPFRGIIREISGANEQQRRMQAAIEAGIARRGFLKGLGAARGCRYPARPASGRDLAEYRASLTRSAQEREQASDQSAAVQGASEQARADSAGSVTYTSVPVIQKLR